MKHHSPIDTDEQSAEQLRVTLASIGDAVIVTDPVGKITFMNPVAEELTGWTCVQAAERPLEEVFRIANEFTRAIVENPVAKVLREGRIVGLANHTVLIRRDGTEHPIDDSAAPVRAPGGAILGVVLVFRDVTERRRAELAALRLAAIVEHSVDAIVGKDLNGIVTNWNGAAERIFGYSADEMIGQPITRIIPADRLNEEPQIIALLSRGEIVQPFESIRLRKDGRPIHVRLSISPIKDKEGRIVGASKIARDITVQWEAQQKIAGLQAELQARAQLLEQRVQERTAVIQEKVEDLEAFSYSLSHDMRAPLRAITSYTQIVLDDCGAKLGPVATGHLRRVVHSALRMDRLIHDVLAFSSLTQRAVAAEPVDVTELVDDIISDRLEWQPPSAQVRIDRPLGRVRGHAALLTQCLANLIDNAVKFVAKGETPQVRIRTEPLNGEVRLWVEDRGIGINAEAKRRLFTLFERLHAPGRYEGVGIGLAIVRKAAERMRGKVGVESEPGRGSRFWLQLPKA